MTFDSVFIPFRSTEWIQLSIDENELVHSLFAFFVGFDGLMMIDGFETFAHSTLKTA